MEKLTYINANLSDLSLEINSGKRGEYVEKSRLIIPGQDEIATSQRFWKSFNRRFGVTENIFNYFSGDEVLKAVSEKNPGQILRIAVEDGAKALAVSEINGAFINQVATGNILADINATDVKYRDGVISAILEPQRFNSGQVIGGDSFANRFGVEIPVDGFGAPTFFLGLLRVLCQNGMIAVDPVFQTEVRLGNQDAEFTLRKAITAFNNEEGFDMMYRKIALSQISFASVAEVMRGVDAINDVGLQDHAAQVINTANIGRFAYSEDISEKRRRRLESGIRVYELINMLTELSTHKHGINERKLNQVVGNLLANDFDLEKSAIDKPMTFPDFYFKKAA